ncbi:MAG: beta-ketoadipate enol-lactone hydrolase [Frankiales bacterium]|nr:beta-ketoadipate enol-lactone hydrolase [Frankiales bacterium]
MLATATGTTNGIATRVLGEGLPVTVFAHGLGGSTAECRPLAARVGGTRVLMDFRGHGDSDPLVDGWDYDLLAGDLLAVADATGATQAVGLSLGAGALMRLLSRDPERFDRLAFVMPAAIDSTRRDGATVRLERLGDAIRRGDAQAAADCLLEELPHGVRDRRGVSALVLRRAQQLVVRPAPQPRSDDRPVSDRAQLAQVAAPALVVGQADDPLHPMAIARELTLALPNATLRTFGEGGVFWTEAEAAQTALALHLGAA